MPIYEYQCENCEHKIEIIQKNNAEILKNCPKCKKDTFRKLISVGSFKLTGSGWYETDFKNKQVPENKNNSDAKETTKEKTKETTKNTTKEKTKEISSKEK